MDVVIFVTSRIYMQSQNTVVDALKKECICEFNHYIKALQKGHCCNYQDVLNLICFINNYYKFENQKLISEYFLSKNKCAISPIFESNRCVDNDGNSEVNTKYLIRNNFLSEYKTYIDKKRVLTNLGIKELNWNDVT